MSSTSETATENRISGSRFKVYHLRKKRIFAKNTTLKEIKHKLLRLRAATPEDAPFIAWAIAAALHKEESDDGLHSLFCEICQREDTLYSWRNTIIADYEGKAIGALTCYDGARYRNLRDITFPLFSGTVNYELSQMEMETSAGEFYIDSMSVLPEYRKQGVATALLKTGIDRARELSIDKASLVVLPSNTGAKRLYESLGFEYEKDMFLFCENYQKYCLGLVGKTPKTKQGHDTAPLSLYHNVNG